jgi:4-hydroxy-tetrahydrodipicolinate reductase
VLNVAVLGATGRMGQSILRCIADMPDIALAGAVTIPGDPALGEDAGIPAGLPPFGVVLTDDRRQALDRAQVAIDFTLSQALEGNLEACVETGTALVIGTTGLDQGHFVLIDRAAHDIPLVYARNMSVGVNVFMSLVGTAARALGDDYDVEIIEAHHRHKVDAPSGTALAVGEIVAKAKGHALEELAVRSRDGQIGPRVPRTIGFSVIRGGDIVGEHTVMFVAPEERIEFVHRAGDRRTFARGALRAARWVAGRAPGRYTMADVLGLQTETP